jgi:hypothetical protein
MNTIAKAFEQLHQDRIFYGSAIYATLHALQESDTYCLPKNGGDIAEKFDQLQLPLKYTTVFEYDRDSNCVFRGASKVVAVCSEVKDSISQFGEDSVYITFLYFADNRWHISPFVPYVTRTKNGIKFKLVKRFNHLDPNSVHVDSSLTSEILIVLTALLNLQNKN